MASSSSPTVKSPETFELKFLDLKLSSGHTKGHILTKEKDELFCWSKKKHNHCIHSDNEQLNTILDLILNLGFDLENNILGIKAAIKSIATSIKDKNKILKEFQENCEAIRKTQNAIFTSFNKRLEDIPTKEDLQKIVNHLEQKPKEIERETRQLLLETKNLVLENKQQFLSEIEELKKILEELKYK